jgi:hypothetical protein
MLFGIWAIAGWTVKATYVVRKASSGSTASIVLTEQMLCRWVLEGFVLKVCPVIAFENKIMIVKIALISMKHNKIGVAQTFEVGDVVVHYLELCKFV